MGLPYFISIHNENIKNLSSEITSKSVGETVIRFVYNNIIKKVNIIVTESEIINPSDPTEVYSLNDTPHIVVPNNANTVINTNTKLLNSNSSFTLFVDFEGDPALRGNSSAQPTLIHCMRETNPWPGLVCHYESNGLYMIWYKAENDGSKPNNIKLLDTSEFATRNSLTLVHTENTNTVDIYFNGTFVKKLSCGTYIPPFDINKPCIIGANMDDGKSYRRYFNGTIWRAKIYNEVKSADFI